MSSKYGYMATIGADTSGLKNALAELDKESKSISAELRQVNNNLKFDDGGTVALTQKQELLGQAIENTKKKLSELQAAEAAVNAAAASGKISEENQRSFQRELDSTKNKLNRYRTELSTVNAALNDTAKASDSAEKETKEFGNELEKAGSSAASFGTLVKANVAGDLITSVIKRSTTAALEFAKMGADAAAKLVKSAVDSYGEYEQLVGGVETLFKTSAVKVMGYASNAYKTAGLSANKYMETVTGFSASLIQSLGGDTKKAADIANQAVIDMSDNVNKMGTPMQSIQNAYQGFAKQNFTMLDNLKLGYGGAKKEMERLLADAEKLSGIRYDISSFSDMVQAIHVIQEDLGITGTTAKEAAETIQGSFASAKAAWDNIITGLANDKADFDGLIQDFVTAATTAAENMLPAAENAIGGIGDLMGGLLPEIADKIPSMVNNVMPKMSEAAKKMIGGVVDGINENADTLTDTSLIIVDTVAETILTNSGKLLDCVARMVTSIVKGIGDRTPELVPAAVQAVMQFATGLSDNLGEIVSAAGELVAGLHEGIIDSIPGLIEAAPELLLSLGEAIISAALTLWVDLPARMFENVMNGIAGLETGDTADKFINNLAASFEKSVEKTAGRIQRTGERIRELLFPSTKVKEADAEKYLGLSPAELKAQLSEAEDTISEYNGKLTELRNGTFKFFDEEGNEIELSDEDIATYTYHYEKLLRELTAEKTAILAEYQQFNEDVKYEAGLGSETMAREMEARGKAAASAYSGDIKSLEEYEAALKEQLEAIEDDYNLHKIVDENGEKDEAEYYRRRRELLEQNADETSELWWKSMDECTAYEKKQNEERLKAQQKADDDAKKQTEQAEKERVDAIKKSWDRISALHDRGDIDDEKEYKLKARLVKKYCNENEDTWDSYYTWLYQYTKKKEDDISKAQLDAWKKNAQELSDTLKKSYEDLVKEKEAVKKELLGIDLTETIKDKDGNDVTVLTDLDAEIKKIDELETSLAKLKNLGASDALMAEIGKMSYKDGSRQRYIDELLALSPDKLDLYFSDFNRLQEKAENASQNMIQDKADKLNEQTAETVRSIYKDMPAAAYQEGVETANSYIQGILDSMGSVNGQADISKIFGSAGYDPSSAAYVPSAVNQALAGLKDAVVSVQTPVTINLNDKQYVETTIGELINGGRLSGGNTFNS